MSRDCNFRNVTAEVSKTEYIRDAFISGLSCARIRQRLLENTSLTLQAACDQARALEMAELQSAAYSISVSSAAASNELEPKSKGPDEIVAASSKRCFFCGYDWHPRSSCPAKDAQCKFCNKIGHFKRVCKSKSGKVKQNTSASVNTLATVTAASPPSLLKSTANITVNGVNLKALIDTGSSMSFINLALIKKCDIQMIPHYEKISMANASLHAEIVGQCKVNLEIESYCYKNVTLLVMNNLCADVIIGHDILKDHSALEITFHGNRPVLKICSLAIAHVPPVSLFANLTKDCRPISTKSRRHSKEDTEFINKEIEKLLQERVIEPSNSPWRAQAFVVRENNHKTRMVIDYSKTINKYTLLDAYPLPRIETIISKVSENEVFSVIDLKSAYHQIPILESERKYTAFEASGKLFHFLRVPFGVTNGVASFQRVIDRIVTEEKLQGTYPYLDDVTVCGRNQEEHDYNLNKFLAAIKKYNLTLNKEKCKFSEKSVTLLGYVISNKTIRPDPSRMKPLQDLPAPTDTASLQRALGMFSYYSKWIPRFSQKVRPLLKAVFPLTNEAISVFNDLKMDIANAATSAILDQVPFQVETDASDFAIAATLSQSGRPVAFFSRMLNKSERHHPPIEKEAYAIVESLRYWRHYLIGRPFTVITDQRSVSYMFHQQHNSKIKNEKIMRWRLELSCFKFDIIFRPGNKNASADALSRISATVNLRADLSALHDSLCHPGITRMAHWIRAKNLPHSIEEIRKVTNACQICSELKPRFYSHEGNLIKATSPFERLNMDFKGPLPTKSKNKYLLTVVDEYSRFPFAFPCSDVSTTTVIKKLTHLFALFGTPAYIHTDRGASFMSSELKSFLTSHGIATSRTTPYNPMGNGQAERFNGIIWKTVMLALRSKGMKTENWEEVLEMALHSIRSLLCTATNASPHERMFNHQRRSFNGISMPSWLTEAGPVLMKKHIRASKYEPLVEEVELLESNPDYAYVRFPDGRESTVSTRYLAPKGDIVVRPQGSPNYRDTGKQLLDGEPHSATREETSQVENLKSPLCPPLEDQQANIKQGEAELGVSRTTEPPTTSPRDGRPVRTRRQPAHLSEYVTNF